MTYPILPKLRVDHNVKSLTEAGKWDLRDQDSLRKLSDGLNVDKVETEISSIPDMWARPILFEMALINREHVLYERIRGEWRGVLAMLGLKEVLGLSGLTASAITIPNLPPSKDGEHETSPVNQRDFMLTLAKLLPKASLAGDTTWQTLYVFLYNNRPFAMTSPSTLVATASDYLNRISNLEVKWFDGTYLKDPVPFLSHTEKEILSGWIANLITALGRHPAIDLERWNGIAGELKDFARALGPGNSKLGSSAFGIHGEQAGIFRFLDKPAEGKIERSSHVKLIPSETRSPEKPLLVVDKGIAEQWQTAPQNVTVHGAQTLATARIRVNDAEVWKKEDFFTKKLFVISQQNAFRHTSGNGHRSLTLPGGTSLVTPILPLNSKLLQYLTAEILADRVRWDQTPEGLQIHLLLRLSGPDPDDQNGQTIELTKSYRREDIYTLDNVPILEVWPNFKAPDWKAYYTCYSTDDASSTFTARPFAVSPIVSSEVQLQGRARRLYWCTEEYPEAIVCHATIPNVESKQMEKHEGGLLLLAQPNSTQARDLAYKVGVDFGAASTSVCARFADGEPDLVKFKNRNVSITASGERAQAELFNFFLPSVETDMPVLSFFQSFDNNDGQQLRPFMHGHIYLLPGVGNLDPNQKGMAFDLKWSSEDRHRRMVKAFLGQLCLQTLAELKDGGAASVTWSFSYPTAFSEEQLEGFPTIWEQVTKECEGLTGLKRNPGIPNYKNLKQTESVATALFFQNKLHAATQLGTIFMDIGGSTSDISLWKNKRAVWQTSVLFAGRNLFSNYLWHNPDFLGLFGSAGANLPEEKVKCKGDRKSFYAVTDALLRYNSELIFSELPVHAGSASVKLLRQHLALGIGGLFYYVGSLLQHLAKIGLLDSNVPNIYIGGNGSRVFRWLDIDGEKRINALYKKVFSRGANWADEKPFNIILSPKPKAEAAWGLVCKQNLTDEEPERQVLAGETFIAEGTIVEWPEIVGIPEDSPRTLPWDSVLTPEALTKKLLPSPKLDRLSDFISAFNDFARSKGVVPVVDPSNQELEEVRRRLGESLSRYHGATSTNNILVEPVFIMALRDWLDIRLERDLD
jgi:hypothetical protein